MNKFFFNYARKRTIRNRIRGCKVEDGRCVDDQDELTYHDVQYF